MFTAKAAFAEEEAADHKCFHFYIDIFPAGERLHFSTLYTLAVLIPFLNKSRSFLRELQC